MLGAYVNAFRTPDLRRKLLFTLGLLLAFRVLASISIPGADAQALNYLFSGNSLLGLLNLFSGGGLQRFTIVALGLNPYINATIIMQLMAVVSTRLKELSKEGEVGRKKITQGLWFSEDGWKEIEDFFVKVIENFELAAAAFSTGDEELARKVQRHRLRLAEIEDKLKQTHISRLHKGLKESLDTSSIHLDLLAARRHRDRGPGGQQGADHRCQRRGVRRQIAGRHVIDEGGERVAVERRRDARAEL